MTDITKCPKCNSEYTYFDGMLYVCPDCAHEFSADDTAEEATDGLAASFLRGDL